MFPGLQSLADEVWLDQDGEAGCVSLSTSFLISLVARSKQKERKKGRKEGKGYTRNNNSPDIRPRQQIRILFPRARILRVKVDGVSRLFARVGQRLRRFERAGVYGFEMEVVGGLYAGLSVDWRLLVVDSAQEA